MSAIVPHMHPTSLTLLADLTVVQRFEYGTKVYPSFCPVRDYGIPVIAGDSTFLQFYLLIAEVAVRAPQTTILSRRATIYLKLREIVAKEGSRGSDSSLVLLAGLASTESRLGNVGLAHTHYEAATRWVNMRGGLKTLHDMYFAHGLGIVRCFVQQGMALFNDEKSVVLALRRLRLSKGTLVDARLWKYLESGHESRQQIANLHMLNMVMSNEPADFIKELVAMTTGSGERLTPSALQFMILTCAFRVGRWHGKKPAIRSWETIEFVELISYASVSTRRIVVESMHAWLTGVHCPEVDMQAVKEDIARGWRQARSK